MIQTISMTLRDFRSCRKAFTLVELLVVIAIIGVVVGLAAPAVQAVRESSRRSACHSKLTMIGMALHSYHDRWTHFPVGTLAETGPVKTETKGNHHNWIGRLTDLLDQPVVATRIDRSVSVYAEANRPVLQLRLPILVCPSAAELPHNASSYVGLHHESEKQIDESDHGVFVLNEPISRDDITDGLSNTAMVSEKVRDAFDLGWMSGTRATLRNVGDGISVPPPLVSAPAATAVGSIGSRHPGGVHILLGAGAVRFQSEQTDERILQQLADRRDGQLPMAFQSLDELRRQSVQ